MKRGVRRDKSQLWTDGRVYYRYDSTINSVRQGLIRRALVTLEGWTCLEFVPYVDERNYITFRSRGPGCGTNSIGRKVKAGEQYINLGSRCFGQKTILHEVCHALGMWHEQSRPDRDEYVQIVESNIKDGGKSNFLKRNVFQIDSQGAVYDYASVMHYSSSAFSKVKGQNTIEVINQEEYEKQGSPKLGRGMTLSKLDVFQLNRLYNCPGSGIPGALEVHIQHAKNLGTNQNSYVMVTAYDDHGFSETRVTRHVENSGDPNWDTRLNFGKRISWQYIDVSIWDYDTTGNSDNVIISPQSYSVNPGHHNRELCNNWNCNTMMTFSMSLTDTCHCFSGGTCLPNDTCACAVGYRGPRCEFPHGRLSIFARNAKNLMDRDYGAGTSDAYLKIQAYNHHGGSEKRYTNVIKNDLNPVWNEWVEFEENEWSWFTVQALDEDTTNDALLSDVITFPLRSFTSIQTEQMESFKEGVVIFDYIFER